MKVCSCRAYFPIMPIIFYIIFKRLISDIIKRSFKLLCSRWIVKPRPGTCPSQLSPPPGPCASDVDECMFDWDCEGTTKKCCSNKCFKECAEPALIGGIRGNTPMLWVYIYLLSYVCLLSDSFYQHGRASGMT